MPGHADPREALIRAALNTARATNGISAEQNARLLDLFDDIAAEIARIDPTAPGAKRWRDLRVQKLLDRVEELLGETYDEWYKGVRSDMARLGRVEGLQVRADLVASLGDAGGQVKAFAPTQNMLKAILDTSVFGDVKRGMETLKGWSGVQEKATLRSIRQQIQLGMMNEESIDQLVRRIRGKSDGRGGFRDGVMQTTTKQARTLVRTAATHITAEARMLTFRENPRIIAGVQFVSALDSRTCPRCGALDGEVWPLDDHATVEPPVHLNCRCTLVSVTDWDALGMDPPEPGMRAARDENGKWTRVPQTQDYEGWLRDQPMAVKVEVLGRRRAELFEAGKIRLDEVVGKEQRILTLDELEARL